MKYLILGLLAMGGISAHAQMHHLPAPAGQVMPMREPFRQVHAHTVIYNLYITDSTANFTGRRRPTIAVNGSGATIYLDGNIDSTGGTLTATNGQFIFRGSNTAAPKLLGR